MGITVEFQSYEEMVDFANKLVGTSTEVKKPVKQESVKPQEPVKQETTSITEEPTEEEKTYSLEEVRAALAVKTREGKQKEVKALFAEFSAAKLSEVKESDYPALMEKAGAL